MAWFRNHYVCIACAGHWLAERAERQDDDCPFCRAYDVAPYRSDDWSVIIEPAGDTYVVLACVEVAAQKSRHAPHYREVGRFSSRAEAKTYVAAR